ncbi:CAP domain-containing protein [Morchella snyderi]|nr:CAP domain-containing protein [Morchella snyderi]
MRYSLSTLACAALAATTLAAPVIDKRAREVLIFTDFTTIIVTKTITTGAAESTPEVQVEWANGGHYGRKSSTYGAPVYTTRTTTLEPITIGTRTTTLPAVTSTVEPVTIVTSTPAAEVPGTTTVVQEVTSSPEPVTVITTIQDETAAAPTTVAPVETTTSEAPVPTTVAPVETTTSVAPVPTTTAAATTTSVAVAPADTWAADVLNAHNTRRALHGAPALTWDSTMASYATSISAKCVFEHSGGPYGENLAAGYATPEDAIEAWYAENTSYNYAAGLFSEATGHFTQLVWASATKVGCGIATCGTSTTPGDMLTCEYDTGNVIGYFVQNVLPLV